jgi:hypothetical protein
MIVLHKAGGAADFTLTGEACSKEHTRKLCFNATRLLHARGLRVAAKYLESIHFNIMDAINNCNDEFCILYSSVPLDTYEDLRIKVNEQEGKIAFSQIARTLDEVGQYVRFIAVELEMTSPGQDKFNRNADRRLNQQEINKLVYGYIGVHGGYLGDFSYRSHHEFYIQLNLDINPYEYDGTTRQRFINIIRESPAEVQAKILKGILKLYPAESSNNRTKERYDEIIGWITRLEGISPVVEPSLRITSQIVDRALSDAEQLLRTTGATSGVDRIHTALHGYLLAVCDEAKTPCKPDASLTEGFKHLRENHPAFRITGSRDEEIIRIVRAISNILDAMNPLRNRASVAHPNEALLEEPEAMLVINCARTLLHYLDEKIHQHQNPGNSGQ